MRIQVVFNNTPILVPCGDGKLTVGELIQKAIVRFKKLGNKHHEATIEVRSLRLADSGSFVDEDDEVADVLEDKETVLLDYEYIPHFPRDSMSGETASVTFSPSTTGEDHAPYSGTSLTDPMAPVSSEGYATAESTVNDIHTASQEQDELGHHEGEGAELHMSHLEASQDTELVAEEAWHSPSSQERSPHLGRKTHRWNSTGAGRDILLGPSQDSGYDPTRSQESYNQPKSQEGFIPGSSDLTPAEGSAEYNLPGNRGSLAFTSGSQTSLTTKRQGSSRKDEDGPKPHDPFPKEGRFGQRGRDGPHDGLPPTPTRAMGIPGSFQRPEYGYRGQRDSFAGYPGSYGDTGFDDGYDFQRGRYPPSDWRRSYHTDYHHHEISPYGRYDHYEPPHMRGRFDRPLDSMRGRFPQARRERLISEESRMHRARSHERMDAHPPYMGPGVRSPWEDPREGGGAMDYFEFLSQPNPSYFGFDRPGFNPGPAPAMMGYDSRQAMAGPSGYSLSQPGHMMSHGRMHGEFDRSRMPPWAGDRGGSLRATRGVLKGDGYDNRGRRYSIEEEFDRLDELDELEERERGVGGSRGDIARSNPFQRNFRKSMFRDGPAWSQWMERIHEYGIQDDEDGNEIPEFEGENSRSQSQRTPSPTSSGQDADTQPKENGEEDSDEDEFGNIHIIELHKGEEPLGVHLTHYTSPEGSDLGVFIGAMDGNGFAATSNKLQVWDRILACNGVDFTKETNKRVEELFLKMLQEPLLRIAISRGLQLNLPQLMGEGGGAEGEEPRQQQGASAAQPSPTPPPGKIASSSTQPPSTSVTNTRQIGVKHTITLSKGPRGLGFGLTSRDVATDDSSQPIYIKSITTDGPAFVDGRLVIGDRLLEVNGCDIVGMDQPRVVQLLREAEGSITLVISRQETVDTQEEEFPLSEASQPTTVGKTVMTFDIPLYNSGPAGLGVTVYGRTSLSSAAKRSGDMGIYIKSIVPGGAAALDARVCRNDQLLCINSQSLLGRSNNEALEVLRGALATASGESSSVQLVVARRAGINRKASLSMSSFSSSMAALGEEPEEEERESSHDREEEERHEEVGIDVPAESRLSPGDHSHSRGNEPLPLDHEPSRGSLRHRSETDRDSAHPSHAPSAMRHKPKASTLPSPRTQRRLQQQADSQRPNVKWRQSGGYPSPGSQRQQAQDRSNYPSSPGLLISRLKAAEGAMGSGEFYDRLEPLDPKDRPERSPLDFMSPPPGQSSSFPWRDVERGRDYSSLDRKGMNRSTSQSGSISSSLPPMHARLHHPPSSREGSAVLSPSEVEIAMATAPYGSPHSRSDSLQRPREGSPLDSRYPPYSPYSSDSAASYPLPDPNPQVPTRGSGRRSKPERGSGRNQGGASISPPSSEHTPEFSTYPRSASRSSIGPAATPINPETSSLCSLEHLRLSDSEQPNLRRDDIWRISITKKSKKDPKKDFANFGYANVEPLVEGEAPALVRTGSDPCLANLSSTAEEDLLAGMELGPNLGLVKSSSLESLHNVMHLQIRRDSGSDLRTRETRNSFRRAVDRSYDEGGGEQHEQQQRGVDVTFDVSLLNRRGTAPALMSLTKSPMPMGKKPQSRPRKKGFLKRVFKRKGTKKGGDHSPDHAHRDGVLDSCDELEEDMPTNGHYQLQTSSRPRYSIPTKTGEEDPPTVQDYMTQNHSNPILSDDDSTDESLLATMAKV